MEPFLTNYQIKILAALFMAIDHVGVVFFPDNYALRAIGRLSFPLFAWLLVQGEAHTRNIWQYGLRLLILGVISQPFFMLAFDSHDVNILVTLLIGLVCLKVAREFPKYQVFSWVGGAALAELLHADYGAYGIAVIALLWQFKPNLWWWLCWVVPHIFLLIVEPVQGEFQFPVVLTPLIIQVANHQQGDKARWFYLFYPVHLAILYGLNQFI